jgi:thiol-disulfide isomerase/thioredoxin
MTRAVAKIEVFTSSACPFCPDALKIAHQIAHKYGKSVVVKTIYVDNPRGKKISDALGVLATPTVMVNRDVRFTGVPRPKLLYYAVKHVLAHPKVKPLPKKW